MPWTDWTIEELSFKVSGAPAVSSWQEGRLDVFLRSTENSLYHRVFDNNMWQGVDWEEISDGHQIEVSPAAASWGPNRIDLFAVWDKQLHHRSYQNGSWSPWAENLEGMTNDAPAAASWKIERIDALVHTGDDFMSRRFWESGALLGWANWENIGGMASHLLGAPAAVATGPHRIDCFGRGASDHLIHAWYQDNYQQTWAEIDSQPIKDAPAVVSATTADRGRVDVFVRGADDHLKHRVYYSALQPYQPGGDTVHIVAEGQTLSEIARRYGLTLAQIEALNPQITNPDLIHPGDRIVVGHYEAVPGYGDWEPGGSWEDLSPTPIASAPAAVGWWSANIPKRVDCFAQDANNNLMHKWWT